MSSSAYGTLAALASPLMMVVGFVVWDEHWKGSAFALNMFKCSFASFGFLVLSFATRPHGSIFPAHASRPVFYLILSSVCGILLGDLFWLEGLRLLGARRVVVVDAIKPFLAAMMGWAILNETLVPTAFVGMAVTVVGVLVVSLEKESSKTDNNNKNSEDSSEPASESSSENAHGNGAIEHTKDEESTKPPTIDNNPEIDGIQSGPQQLSPPTHESVTVVESDTNPVPCATLTTSETSKRVMTLQSMRKGYIMAGLNVVLDTYGSILTRQYGVDLTTWEINLVRFGFAGACLLILAILFHLRDAVTSSPQYQRQQQKWFLQRKSSSIEAQQGSEPDISDEPNGSTKTSSLPWYCLPNSMTQRSWIHVIIGVILVTFLAPTLSNYALFRIAVAIAITLGSVGPLYVLPLAYLLQHERPTTRAMLGSLLAVAGIAILAFWRDYE